MTFYGKEWDVPAEAPIRSWTYSSRDGREHEVSASYVNFMPEHVSFWIENGSKWDTLVLAEVNGDVRNLREVA